MLLTFDLRLRAVFLFAIFLCSLQFVAQDDPLLWAKAFGGEEWDQANASTFDADGNVIVVGMFRGTVNLNTEGEEEFVTAAGDLEACVHKFSPSGELLFTYTFGGVEDDVPQAVITDDENNIYISGHFEGVVDFDGGSGEDVHISGSDPSVFVTKLSSDGTFIWAKTFANFAVTSSGRSMAFNSSGELLIAGSFGGQMDFDPSDDEYLVSSAGSYDVYLLKLNTDGEFMWVKTFGGTDVDSPKAMHVTQEDDIYIVGNFAATADFDPSDDTHLLNSNGNSDVFIVRLDPAGELVWAAGIGGDTYDYGYGVETDGQGDVVVVGRYQHTADFDPGEGEEMMTANGGPDSFFLKLSADADYIWSSSIGAVSQIKVNDLAIDQLGAIYTVGEFYGSQDFDPGSGAANLGSMGTSDGYLHKLNSQGEFQWVYPYASTGYERIESLEIDAGGAVLMCGYFGGDLDLETTSGPVSYSSNGEQDWLCMLLDNQLSISSSSDDLSVGAYPNPANGGFTVTWDPKFHVESIAVSDIQGRLISQHGTIESTRGKHSFELEPGVYVVHVIAELGSAALRVVVK